MRMRTPAMSEASGVVTARDRAVIDFGEFRLDGGECFGPERSRGGDHGGLLGYLTANEIEVGFEHELDAGSRPA